jgi:hypothetical protein
MNWSYFKEKIRKLEINRSLTHHKVSPAKNNTIYSNSNISGVEEIYSSNTASTVSINSYDLLLDMYNSRSARIFSDDLEVKSIKKRDSSRINAQNSIKISTKLSSKK